MLRPMHGALCVVASVSSLWAQCDPAVLPGQPASGPLGIVYALAKMANGELVAGGDFRFADGEQVNHVARFDGTAWHALGLGVDNQVTALAVTANGDLIAAGEFTTAGGLPASGVARWNGTAWSAIGTETFTSVEDVLALPNGNLLVSTHVGDPVRLWDGTAWMSMSAGLNSQGPPIVQLPNGALLAGDWEPFDGGALKQWNGSTWASVTGSSSILSVLDLVALPNGWVGVLGEFGTTSSAIGVWTGTLTVPYGTMGGTVLGHTATGDLVVGGIAFGSGGGNGTVHRWNGLSWVSLGDPGSDNLRAFTLDAAGNLVVGGQSRLAHATSGGAVARYDGVGWNRVGAPAGTQVDQVVSLPNGDVVLGGSFASIDGVAAQNIARFDGVSYAPLGLGLDGPVQKLCATDGSVLVAAGAFSHAGTVPANRIARWNGTVWSAIGAGLPAVPSSIAANDAGEVLALIGSALWRFDGVSWATVVAPGTVGVASMPGGDFALGGAFASVGGPLLGGATGAARMSQGVVSLLPPIGFVLAFGRADDGALLATVNTAPRQVMRLDGAAFTSLGGPPAGFEGVTTMADGSVLTWGRTGTGATTLRLYRHDGGTGWSQFGPDVAYLEWTPVDGPLPPAVAFDRNGGVLVAGDPIGVAGMVSAGLVRLVPTCPAGAGDLGGGCSSSAGPVVLTAHNLAWLGGTFRATVTGLPPFSLAAHVIGVTPVALPLPGAPGCTLGVDPILVGVLVPAGGHAEAPFAVPWATSLTGLQARTQVVGIEFAPLGGVVGLSSSNVIGFDIGQL